MHRDITEAYLQACRPPVTGRLEIHDSQVRGLSLRITADDVRSWAVRARTGAGKRTRVTFGHYPEISIKEARKRARALLARLEAGNDLSADKKAARSAYLERQAAPTVAERLGAWQSAMIAAGKWRSSTARETERLCRKFVIPKLGTLPLKETTRRNWVGMIQAESGARPATAAWLYSIASSFLNYSEACGWLEIAILPRRGGNLIAPKAPPRQRALSDDELLLVWHAATRRAPHVRAFLRLLLLTGCRVSEAAGICKGELDLAAKRWTIPASRAKNGRALTVPLPGLLAAELSALIPADAGPGYALLGVKPGKPLQAITRVKEAVDKASGVAGWRLHDLRRTARTGMARLGVSTEHAEAALNHVSGRTALERVYNVHDYASEVIAALERWQAFVLELVKPKEAVAPAA